MLSLLVSIQVALGLGNMVTSLTWFLMRVQHVASPNNLVLGLEVALFTFKISLVFFLYVVPHFLSLFSCKFTPRTLHSGHHLCQWSSLTLLCQENRGGKQEVDKIFLPNSLREQSRAPASLQWSTLETQSHPFENFTGPTKYVYWSRNIAEIFCTKKKNVQN